MSALPDRAELAGSPSRSTLQTLLLNLYDMVAQRLAAGTTGAGTATAPELELARQSLGLEIGVDVPGLSVTPLGTRNKIINGNPLINQRGVSGTVVLAAGAYGHDRWKAGASGCTYTFATVNNVTTITISAGSLQQVIEGLNLQSGTHILSWTGTAQGKIGAGSYSASGVTGTATGGTNLTVEFNTGTLSLVQLEVGTVATPFEHRPYGAELALCQRYYERGFTNSFGASSSTTSANIYVRHKITKRASPTVSQIAGSSLSVSIDETGTAFRTPGAVSGAGQTVDGFTLTASSATYAAALRPVALVTDVVESVSEL